MNPRFATLWSGTVAVTVATLLVSAAPADAQLSAGAIKCRASVAKAYSKLVATAGKTIASCHKSRNGSKIGAMVDCNDMAQADSAGKFAAAGAKIADTFAKSCAGLDGTLVGPDYYMSCPEPCGTDEGLPNPMTTLTQVATCMSCLAGSIMEDVSENTLGMPDPAMLSKDDAKCHGAIAKGYQKFLTGSNKIEHACQGDADDAGDYDVSGCVDNDPAGKAAGALAKAGDGIDKSCAAANLANLDSCAADTAANLKSCNGAAYDAAGDEAFTTAYELPATICPTGVASTIRAGCSTGSTASGNCTIGGNTQSILSVGWSGLGHGVDIADGYTLAATVTCPGSEAGSCGDCTIDGIDPAADSYASFARCEAAPWTPCTNPFGNDAACPSAGLCGYYLGPPLPVSAGGTPTCTLNRINTDISGTANPDAGSTELSLDLRAKVHNGVSQTQPCPVCDGDTTPQDGVKNGTCIGGARNGQTCDIQAFDLNYSPTDVDTPTVGLSLDCPPSAAQNISGTGLVIDLPLTTGSTILPFGDKCDGVINTLDCVCGVCSHDNTVPCNGDATCDALSSGSVCGKGSSGANREPNSCTGYTCTDIGPDDRGQCADLQKSCSGAVRANGDGIIACAVNADCDAFITGSGDEADWVCPNDDCGDCTLQKPRSCFLNPIQVSGTPDVDNPVMAGLFCLPPTTNSGVNSSTGSPGPGEVKVDALVELSYD